MKLLMAFMLLALFTMNSCKKSDHCGSTPTSLAGTWKMVLVKDNTSGVETSKPSALNGDVIISFSPVNSTQGSMSGNSPSNQLGPNDYTLGPNQAISIPSLTMTKIAETSWGKQFVDNIRSADAYSFGACSRLVIKTASKDLHFEKQ